MTPSMDCSRRPNNFDRNTKHGRGGRAPPRDGKRAYERRSGTGRGKEIKRSGGGPRNWGNDRQEAKRNEGKVVKEEDEVVVLAPAAEEEEGPTVVEGTVSNEGDEVALETTTAEEGQEPKEEGEEPVPEPEDKTMTYAEYMAAQKAKKEAEAKKVQERQVENEFAGKVAAKKSEEDFLVMGGGKQKKTKKKNAEKELVPVSFRVVRLKNVLNGCLLARNHAMP